MERTSETAGDPAVKLMQSVPLTEMPAINGARMDFTLGAVADYHFKLLDYGLTPDIAETYVDWTYDAFGRKIAESTYDGTTLTAQTVYVWDGWRLLSEVDGLTGKPAVEYIPGPGFVDDVIASRHDLNHNGSFEDSEIFYHLTDQQYSTIALLDSGGHLVERYDYDPFGVPSIYAPDGTPRSQSAYGNTRLYTGRQWLPALGLYDYRQRLYNPHTGRFLSTDPADDPANLGNPYTYVGNNPLGYLDPFGEEAIDPLFPGTDLDQYPLTPANAFADSRHEPLAKSVTSGAQSAMAVIAGVLPESAGFADALEPTSQTQQMIRSGSTELRNYFGFSAGGILAGTTSRLGSAVFRAVSENGVVTVTNRIVVTAEGRIANEAAELLTGTLRIGRKSQIVQNGILGRIGTLSGRFVENGFEEHHIIPKALDRNQLGSDLRRILYNFDIDINDSANIAVLPGPGLKDKLKLGSIASTYHRGIHTENYLLSILERIKYASDADDARQILRRIGQELEKGIFE